MDNSTKITIFHFKLSVDVGMMNYCDWHAYFFFNYVIHFTSRNEILSTGIKKKEQGYPNVPFNLN